MSELRRLIVRHRHVAPMVSALLAGTDAAVTIRDAQGDVVLERTGAGAGEGTHEVAVEGETLGSVEGGRAARGVAAVLAYAAARERDKRSLANEALERYRELSLIYDLAEAIGGTSDVESIVDTAIAELARLPHDAHGFLYLSSPDGSLAAARGTAVDATPLAHAVGVGVIGSVAGSGIPELLDDAAGDERATEGERAAGSIVAAPLRAGDTTIGVVGATSTAGTFRAADLKVVTAIAALAGPAIGRAIATEPGR